MSNRDFIRTQKINKKICRRKMEGRSIKATYIRELNRVEVKMVYVVMRVTYTRFRNCYRICNCNDISTRKYYVWPLSIIHEKSVLINLLSIYLNFIFIAVDLHFCFLMDRSVYVL